MKLIHRFLFSLHVFVGIGAIMGGAAAILNPLDPLGVSVDSLRNSPFSDYLIPGVILFFLLGLGNIISALLFSFRLKLQGYISSIFSWALVIWIVVQCIMLNDVVFLHVLFFIIGLIQAGLSIILLFEQRLFPTNVILTFYKGIRKDM